MVSVLLSTHIKGFFHLYINTQFLVLICFELVIVIFSLACIASPGKPVCCCQVHSVCFGGYCTVPATALCQLLHCARDCTVPATALCQLLHCARDCARLPASHVTISWQSGSRLGLSLASQLLGHYGAVVGFYPNNSHIRPYPLATLKCSHA